MGFFDQNKSKTNNDTIHKQKKEYVPIENDFLDVVSAAQSVLGGKLDPPPFEIVGEWFEFDGGTYERDVLYFKEFNHTYWYNDIQVPSVTTVIKHAPACLGFAYNPNIPAFVLKKAADKGTLVHEYIEAFLNGEDVSERPLETSGIDCSPYIDAFHSFFEHYDVEPLLQEQLYQKQCLFAGTIDFIGNFEGDLSIIDWKTQKDATPLKWALQLIAYRDLVIEQYGLVPKRLLILHLKKDGYYDLWEFDTSFKGLWDVLVSYYHIIVDDNEVDYLVPFINDFMTQVAYAESVSVPKKPIRTTGYNKRKKEPIDISLTYQETL